MPGPRAPVFPASTASPKPSLQAKGLGGGVGQMQINRVLTKECFFFFSFPSWTPKSLSGSPASQVQENASRITGRRRLALISFLTSQESGDN